MKVNMCDTCANVIFGILAYSALGILQNMLDAKIPSTFIFLPHLNTFPFHLTATLQHMLSWVHHTSCSPV